MFIYFFVSSERISFSFPSHALYIWARQKTNIHQSCYSYRADIFGDNDTKNDVNVLTYSIRSKKTQRIDDTWCGFESHLSSFKQTFGCILRNSFLQATINFIMNCQLYDLYADFCTMRMSLWMWIKPLSINATWMMYSQTLNFTYMNIFESFWIWYTPENNWNDFRHLFANCHINQMIKVDNIKQLPKISIITWCICCIHSAIVVKQINKTNIKTQIKPIGYNTKTNMNAEFYKWFFPFPTSVQNIQENRPNAKRCHATEWQTWCAISF